MEFPAASQGANTVNVRNEWTIIAIFAEGRNVQWLYPISKRILLVTGPYC